VRRRDFITLMGSAAAAWPLAARAQQAGMKRVSVLSPEAPDDPNVEVRLVIFQQELERLGWQQERNVHIDYRYASGKFDQYAVLARELVASQPDAILAWSTQVAATLKRETRTIPIVFNNVSDPIGAGFVSSLARPDGNLTGILLFETGIMGKWLAMLKEISPGLTRVALLDNPKTSPFDYFKQSAEAAVPSLGIELVPTPVDNDKAEIERAINGFAATPHGGLVVVPDPTPLIQRDVVIALAERDRLPAVYPLRAFMDAGGLMYYGTDQLDLFRLSARYIDRILRGAKPADLPVQAPTKFETIVNLRSAKAMGLTVPPSLLVRADEVIE
jgi:putative ABC transport system substrate-binding protein